MDKDTILDYVTETPGNTNRAVLGSMLDSIGGGEESGENKVLICFESVNLDDVETYTLDKTFREIYEHLNNGGIAIISSIYESSSLPVNTIVNHLIYSVGTNSEGTSFFVRANKDNFNEPYSASSMDDYPSYSIWN